MTADARAQRFTWVLGWSRQELNCAPGIGLLAQSREVDFLSVREGGKPLRRLQLVAECRALQTVTATRSSHLRGPGVMTMRCYLSCTVIGAILVLQTPIEAQTDDAHLPVSIERIRAALKRRPASADSFTVR